MNLFRVFASVLSRVTQGRRQMPRIDIKRVVVDGVEKVVFDPSPLRWSVGDDGIFWANLDPKESHHLTLKGKPDTFWFTSSLAPFVEGKKADTTNRDIFFQTNGKFPYVCVLHKNQQGDFLEEGVIEVV